MVRFKTLQAVPLAWLTLTGFLPAKGAPCLKYEPAIVKLTGVMKRHRFAGPPNYESVEHGDALEVYWLIHLPQPICAEPSDANDEVNEARSGISSLQIIIRDYRRYRSLLGKQVIITGTLSSAITGHHHTPVLIDALEIKRVP